MISHMRSFFFASLLLSTVLAGQCFPQPRFCAKQMLASAESLSLSYAPDAQICRVTASDIDTSGKATAWTYAYASFDSMQVYYFLAQNGQVAFDRQTALATGVSLINDRWMDSDSALLIAQQLGGSSIKLNYPSSVITSWLSQPLAPPFVAEWQIDYDCSGTIRWVRINATTGEYMTSGNFLTSVDNRNLAPIPATPQLSQPYPNPFNPACTIAFTLPEDGLVSLTITGTSGRQVATLASGFLVAGVHVIHWNANGFASGIYFCTLRVGSFVETKKLSLLK